MESTVIYINHCGKLCDVATDSKIHVHLDHIVCRVGMLLDNEQTRSAPPANIVTHLPLVCPSYSPLLLIRC